MDNKPNLRAGTDKTVKRKHARDKPPQCSVLVTRLPFVIEIDFVDFEVLEVRINLQLYWHNK